MISAAALAALDLVQSENWRIAKLAANSELFVECAREAGLDTGPAIGRGVVPILFRDSYETLAASRFLDAHGFYVPPIIQVGVPKDQPRLRFFLSASHDAADIRAVIDCLADFRAQHVPTMPADISAMPSDMLTASSFADAVRGDAMAMSPAA